MTTRILHVVTNVDRYETAPDHPTGLWLSELTHAWDLFEQKGFEQTLVSPAGGHGVMFDFPGSTGLQHLTREIFEGGGVVGAVCHGYCGLLEVKLSDGRNLVDGRALTGFSWREEVAAGVAKLVPYDVEAEMKARGANYHKKPIPFTPYAMADGTLITGQNPMSAKKTAQRVVEALGT